jgi:hypothetical protein
MKKQTTQSGTTATDGAPAQRPVPDMPSNFKQIIYDFTADLTNVYPEYSASWAKWTAGAGDDAAEFKHLFEYCLVFYPKQFFDILNKNEDIFANDATGDTMFLPNVEFKALYNCDGVTEKTRENLWKYLQLILFSTVQSMDNSSFFGDCLKMFDDVDMNDLQSKLKKTMDDMAAVFGAGAAEDDEPAAENTEDDDDNDATPQTAEAEPVGGCRGGAAPPPGAGGGGPPPPDGVPGGLRPRALTQNKCINTLTIYSMVK